MLSLLSPDSEQLAEVSVPSVPEPNYSLLARTDTVLSTYKLLAVCLGTVVSGKAKSVCLEPVTSLLLLSADSVGDDHVPCLPSLDVCLGLAVGGTQTRLRFSGLR